jgi:hypothetical protein
MSGDVTLTVDNFGEVMMNDYEDGEEVKECTHVVLADGDYFNLKGKAEAQFLSALGMKKSVVEKLDIQVYNDLVKISLMSREKPLFVRVENEDATAVATTPFTSLSESDILDVAEAALTEAGGYSLTHSVEVGERRLNFLMLDELVAKTKEFTISGGICVMDSPNGKGGINVSAAWNISSVDGFILSQNSKNLRHSNNMKERLPEFMGDAVADALKELDIEKKFKKAMKAKFDKELDLADYGLTPCPKFVSAFATKYLEDISEGKPKLWHVIETFAFLFANGAEQNGKLHELTPSLRMKVGKAGHKFL